ncbi:hypothetical protein EPUL_005950, partial [Erysiphe pulchra]
MTALSLTRKVAEQAGKSIPAVVISAGLMQKTVKARTGMQEWNSRIKKNFNRHKDVLVHDPNDSLRTGDIISISSGMRVSKTVRHTVENIIAPFGTPIEDRPPIPTYEERRILQEQKRLWKLANKNTKRKGEFRPEDFVLTEKQKEDLLSRKKKR